MVALAQILDLSVVAEGVETADQFAVVKTLGCHFAQGAYLSPPLEGHDFASLLRSGTKLSV